VSVIHHFLRSGVQHFRGLPASIVQDYGEMICKGWGIFLLILDCGLKFWAALNSAKNSLIG